MSVYLVPLSNGRYALYCEANDVEVGQDAGQSRGFLRRWFEEIRAHVKEAEPGGNSGRVEPEPLSASWLHRGAAWLHRRVLSWMAAFIAEQRLLWQLRRRATSRLLHPNDLEATAAQDVMRRILKRDADRHLFWLVFDAIAWAVTGPLLFFIPGPNLVAYYFAFRVFGHYFSWRGARQGLHRVRWQLVASAPLAELRRALELDPVNRGQRIREVSSALELEGLAWFVERTTTRSI
ncbi:MAG: hypothetical protein CL489_15260 [Acidobacteria bacterium]|nr:hypothetical protein [Acidobacteriota bacterium]MBF85813.1 hypothetical protein [Acidobacteriota bacterium]|tara:strand:- start:3267 stop:3971 length:705 start_codon:yes stop_codon:yes gene_type:complete